MIKKVLIMSDLHSGHKAGLTPPDWQTSAKQKDQYDAYQNLLNQIGKVDILVVNGDLIDGKGTRSGGTELIEADRHRQGEIAEECIRQVETSNIVMTYGTPYHAGTEEDFEGQIAYRLGAEIRDMLEFTVEGVNFNIKHKVGGSTIPHGRATPIAREKVWNTLWEEMEVQQKAHVLVRSHVHYYTFTGDVNWLGFTTPAMQGFGSKFGSRQCSGVVNFGMVLVKVYKGQWIHRPYTYILKNHVRKPLQF